MDNTQISQLIEHELRQLANDRQPAELYEPIRYILSIGGKRLRPQLTLLSCSVFSDDLRPAIPAALAMEVFHNFTLLHDDIMDDAALRRGRPTVHTQWNTNVAILSGDAMCILAYHLLGQTSQDKLAIVLPVFNDTALKVCEGQQYDMNFESEHWVTEAAYMKMIELKTATLLAACLQIGALIGGASTDDALRLYRFGIHLGLAFQLQDDLLDTFGDEALLGKKIGKDIVANKKTYLLIKALEKANLEQRQELQRWMAANHNPDEKIVAVKNIFTSLEIDKITQAAINFQISKAIEELDTVAVESLRKKELIAVLEKLNHRRF
ncbi:MAG: polyprenyl synthetase family protein [Bacteroidales bacterium]